MKSLLEMMDNPKCSLVKFINEALSKELENEKNRLHKAFNGKKFKDYYTDLVNEHPEKIIDRLNHFLEMDHDNYNSYLKDKFSSFDEYVEKGLTFIGELFSDKKFAAKLNLDNVKDEKSFLLNEIYPKLDLSRDNIKKIYTVFDNMQDNYDYMNSKIALVEEIENEYCVQFLREGSEGVNGFIFDKKDKCEDFISIIKNGFTVGTPYFDKFDDIKQNDLKKLYTSVNAEKVKGGINFAYTLDTAKQNFKEITDIGGRPLYNTKYGNLGIIFTCKEGLLIYHRDDEELQVLFDGTNVDKKTIIPIYTNFKKNIYQVIKDVVYANNQLDFDIEQEFDSFDKLVKYITNIYQSK